MKIKHIHFLGIGGISMSALAKLAHSKKIKVTGTDDADSTELQELQSYGIQTALHSDPQSIKDSDLIVYTSPTQNHQDLILAKNLNKRIIERAEFLGKIAKTYKTSIAIAGTHGKSTTTALLAHILTTAKLNPTAHIGAKSQKTNSNLKLGGGEYFITEACEYNKSFLHLTPTYSIITNIEADHLDTYKDLNEIQQAFKQFADQTKTKVIICTDNLNSNLFTGEKFFTYGLNPNNDLYASNLICNKGKFQFDCIYKEKYLCTIQNSLLGKHNVQNALASIAISLMLNIPIYYIRKGIETFQGIARRMNILTTTPATHIIDYAHHPTEIQHTLSTLRAVNFKRIIAIFQPHTYTRTKFLMQQFSTAFTDSDYLYVLPTYPAREKYQPGGDATDLVLNIKNTNCTYISNYQALKFHLDAQTTPNTCFVWLGAGDIDKIAQIYTQIPPKP